MRFSLIHPECDAEVADDSRGRSITGQSSIATASGSQPLCQECRAGAIADTGERCRAPDQAFGSIHGRRGNCRSRSGPDARVLKHPGLLAQQPAELIVGKFSGVRKSGRNRIGPARPSSTGRPTRRLCQTRRDGATAGCRPARLAEADQQPAPGTRRRRIRAVDVGHNDLEEIALLGDGSIGRVVGVPGKLGECGRDADQPMAAGQDRASSLPPGRRPSVCRRPPRPARCRAPDSGVLFQPIGQQDAIFVSPGW